jgi:hypothetical protein
MQGFNIAPQNRQRRSQFMGDISQPATTRRFKFLQALRHAIDIANNVTHLVTAPSNAWGSWQANCQISISQATGGLV